jgi:hypothetical protein
MKNRYKLFTATLLIGTLFTTGCISHKAKTPDKKTTKTIEDKKDSVISSKEIIDKNTKLLNKISATEANIAVLEEEIAQTTLGVDRAKLVKNKVQLEQKIEEIQNQQIENAKVFQESRQRND